MAPNILDKIQEQVAPIPRHRVENPNNKTTLYIMVALIVFAIMSMLSVAVGVLDLKQAEKDTFIKVIGQGTLLLGVLLLLLRQDRHTKYVHDREHEQDSKYQALMLSNNVVENKIDKATEKTDKAVEKTEQVAKVTEEFQEEMKKKLNGGLHDTVKKELEALPIPTDPNQFRVLVQNIVSETMINHKPDCDEVALRTSMKTIELLKAEGKLK